MKRRSVIGFSFHSWRLDSDWKGAETPCYVVSVEASEWIWKASFGMGQTPHDLDTNPDIHRLEDSVVRPGYDRAYIDTLFHGNWIPVVRDALQERVLGSQGMSTRNS